MVKGNMRQAISVCGLC